MNVKHALDIVQGLLAKSEITAVVDEEQPAYEAPQEDEDEEDTTNWDPFADADKISALAQQLE